jgi:hypothetical protein
MHDGTREREREREREQVLQFQPCINETYLSYGKHISLVEQGATINDMVQNIKYYRSNEGKDITKTLDIRSKDFHHNGDFFQQDGFLNTVW